MPGLDWLKRPIAHRGLHDANSGIIENTETAFKGALDAGYAIETDVVFSGDQEVMVFHDPTLDRLTTAKGRVDMMSASDLKSVRFKNTNDRMQSLPELLEQVGGRVPLVIEIKSNWTDHGPLEQRLADCLEHYSGPVAVMSFDPRSVAAFAAMAPGIARGLVAEKFSDPHHWSGLTAWQRFRMRHLLSGFIARPQFIAYDIHALPACAPVTARHLLGWPLLTWTVRTEDERRRAARWADAMIFEGFRP